jgi:hypothetical protein
MSTMRTWKMPRLWDRRRVVRAAAVREAGRERWRAMAYRRALAGLTTRGTAPRRRLRAGVDERLTLVQVDGLATALANCWQDLPPSVQVKAIHLASHLGAIKRRLEGRV